MFNIKIIKLKKIANKPQLDALRLAGGGSKKEMGDVFICDEVVKHLAQDIVDTTGLWGLSKPLENFFFGEKKLMWLPAIISGRGQSCEAALGGHLCVLTLV